MLRTAVRGAGPVMPRVLDDAVLKGAEILGVERESVTGEYPPVFDPALHLGRRTMILDRTGP